MIYKNIDNCYFNIINDNKILKLIPNNKFEFIDYNNNNQYLSDDFLFYFNVKHYTESNIEYSIHHKYGPCFNKKTLNCEVLDNRNPDLMFSEKIDENNKQMFYQSLENNIRYIKDDMIQMRYKELTYNPKVSIIIPTYNTNTSQKKRGAEFCGNFFMNAVKSILYQQFTDFELLIINDGITDDTQILLDEFMKKKIKNIKILSVKDENGKIINKGLNYWRTRSIELANCKYVRFLDSDDMLYPDCMQKCWEALTKYNVDCVLHIYDCLVDKKPVPCLKTDTVFSSSAVFSRSTWLSVLFKKSIFMKIKEKEILHNMKWLMEDEIALFFYLSINQKCTFLSDRLYFYRNENRDLNNEEMYENFYFVMKYLIKHQEYEKLQKVLITFRDLFSGIVDQKIYNGITVNKIMQNGNTREKAENIYKNLDAIARYKKIYKNLWKSDNNVRNIIKNIPNYNIDNNFIKDESIAFFKKDLDNYKKKLLTFINSK